MVHHSECETSKCTSKPISRAQFQELSNIAWVGGKKRPLLKKKIKSTFKITSDVRFKDAARRESFKTQSKGYVWILHLIYTETIDSYVISMPFLVLLFTCIITRKSTCCRGFKQRKFLKWVGEQDVRRVLVCVVPVKWCTRLSHRGPWIPQTWSLNMGTLTASLQSSQVRHRNKLCQLCWTIVLVFNKSSIFPCRAVQLHRRARVQPKQRLLRGRLQESR